LDNLWWNLILLGIAGVFGYHAWLGWRTRIVRFPMSVLTFQEFEYDQSPGNFWGIMIVDLLGAAAALIASVFVAWNALAVTDKPIDRLQSLNGCYEGEGLPDFMRPPVHWAFRVEDGVIYNRAGRAVSDIRLLGSTSRTTSIAFSPGILVSSNEHKESTVYVGNIVAGDASLHGSHAKIALADDWGQVMQTTSCG
jgi:hypothetical protein